MATAPRFRSRHLHATFAQTVRDELTALGWITPPINFGADPLTVLDYQPDERGAAVITSNTVAVSLGDLGSDDEEELGAAMGGLSSALYILYLDVYMAEQALTIAVCDDLRDIFQYRPMVLIDQITGLPAPGTQIEIETVQGPQRPPAGGSADVFRRYWRTMIVHGRLYYQS